MIKIGPRSGHHTSSLFTIHSYLKTQSVLIAGFGAQHLSPIQVAALEAHDEHLCAGQIGGDGDVLLVAVADGLDHIGVVVGGIGVGRYTASVERCKVW